MESRAALPPAPSVRFYPLARCVPERRATRPRPELCFAVEANTASAPSISAVAANVFAREPSGVRSSSVYALTGRAPALARR
jgi:hypothetical protein